METALGSPVHVMPVARDSRLRPCRRINPPEEELGFYTRAKTLCKESETTIRDASSNTTKNIIDSSKAAGIIKPTTFFLETQ